MARKDHTELAPTSRPDLAEMLVPLGRALTEAELPILRAHGLTMWAYIVLSALADRPIRSQLQLANAIGADKTRIIAVLDELQDRGLIHRYPDPDDRRVRLLSLTETGGKTHQSARSAIQHHEEQLLSRLDRADRARFLHALQILSALRPEEFLPNEHDA
jgi:DNA-binding MarR family transcriptional regulator